MSKRFRPVPWKRNLNKIPQSVLVELKRNPERNYVVGAVGSFSRRDLEAGVYAHLGIGVTAGNLVYKERVLPPADMGKYSTRNREGWEHKRDDLPMVTRTYETEVPNFGDWGRGSHTISRDRDVYQRDHYDPLDIHILVRKIKVGQDGSTVFKFVVEFPLDRKSSNFEHDMLFALNLSQENTGLSGLLDFDADDESLIGTLDLEWDIFPPGTLDQIVCHMSSGARRSDDSDTILRDRLELFNSLNPSRYLRGRGGLNHYIGAQFSSDLIVFENLRRGNAVYVLYDDWQEVSKRSRIDLLRSGTELFDRFVHTDGWQARLIAHIEREKLLRGLEYEHEDEIYVA